MFGWLNSAFSTVLGLITGSWQTAISAVVQEIRDIFHAYHGYWHTISGRVITAWSDYTRANLVLDERTHDLWDAQYKWDWNISRKMIPFLANWISWLGKYHRKLINDNYWKLYADIQSARREAHSYTASVLAWVVTHVLLYLLAKIVSALDWILSAGDTMWHYFTHLAEFAELLFAFLVKSLEAHAWEVGKLLGEFFLALIVHNMVRFARLVEDIIVAVL